MDTPTREELLEAARRAGREEARRCLLEASEELERQLELQASAGDHPAQSPGAGAVLSAIRASLQS